MATWKVTYIDGRVFTGEGFPYHSIERALVREFAIVEGPRVLWTWNAAPVLYRKRTETQQSHGTTGVCHIALFEDRVVFVMEPYGHLAKLNQFASGHRWFHAVKLFPAEAGIPAILQAMVRAGASVEVDGGIVSCPK